MLDSYVSYFDKGTALTDRMCFFIYNLAAFKKRQRLALPLSVISNLRGMTALRNIRKLVHRVVFSTCFQGTVAACHLFEAVPDLGPDFMLMAHS